MIARIPINCLTREWSNVSEFEDWLREAENTPPARPPESSKNGQKLGFDTYAHKPQKQHLYAPILLGSESDFPLNAIWLEGEIHPVPMQWSERGLIATQIVEGKKARNIMRSQKLVLCQLEDAFTHWFEVAVLGDDLRYPLEEHLIGIRRACFTDYAEARKLFIKFIKRAKAGKEVSFYDH